MSQAAFGGTPFSAEVDLWLELDERPATRIPLSQAGTDCISVAEPLELPAGPGWVVVSVDGELYRNRVLLVSGMSSNSLKAQITCYKDEVPF